MSRNRQSLFEIERSLHSRWRQRSPAAAKPGKIDPKPSDPQPQSPVPMAKAYDFGEAIRLRLTPRASTKSAAFARILSTESQAIPFRVESFEEPAPAAAPISSAPLPAEKSDWAAPPTTDCAGDADDFQQKIKDVLAGKAAYGPPLQPQTPAPAPTPPSAPAAPPATQPQVAHAHSIFDNMEFANTFDAGRVQLNLDRIERELAAEAAVRPKSRPAPHSLPKPTDLDIIAQLAVMDQEQKRQNPSSTPEPTTPSAAAPTVGPSPAAAAPSCPSENLPAQNPNKPES